jgi:ketosteroid isomerase-like protein
VNCVRWSTGLASAVAIVLCSGCWPIGGDGVPAELVAAIDAFYAAVESGDGEARIEMFTDDAIMMPNHWTRIEGREAIAEVIRSGTGSVFRIRDREVLDIDADGGIAYTVNAYDYTYHAEGAVPRWHRTKNVHIWKLDSAGQWRLHVDIWNSDVPMARFDSE